VSLEEYPELRVTGEADDGAEIVAHVRRAAADVVLMDLSMPRVHGLQAVRALRTQLPNVGIIVLSGFEKERMLDRAIAMGADLYIEKRAPLEDIRAAVRRVAAARRGSAVA
jgi:DNA-binding NarL/FixJ family response regulator